MDPAATEIRWSLHKHPHSNPNPITTNLVLEGASLLGQSTIHYKYRDSGYVTRASLTVSRTGWRLSVRSLRITLQRRRKLASRGRADLELSRAACRRAASSFPRTIG